MSDGTRTAFANARYRVSLPGATVDLHIDAPCPAQLTPWVRRHAGATPAWLITAHNPQTCLLSNPINAARAALLQQWLEARQLAVLPALNQDPVAQWPDESGVLIAGVDEGMARSLGRRFDQLAIVAVQAAQPVRLLWI